MTQKNTLLIWEPRSYNFQSNIQIPYESPPYDLSSASCLWCGKPMREESSKSGGMPLSTSESGEIVANCDFCGWGHQTHYQYNYSVHWSQSSTTCYLLKDFDRKDDRVRFDLNDLQVPLEAVGIYLRSHFADVFELSPKRFEELIEDIFKEHGFRTRLTQQTRDGGADIVLLRNDDGTLAIVEVKRYRANRTVGIELVDRLVGSAIRWDTRRAYLVTSSKFSSVARSAPDRYKTSIDLDVELWDASRLLTELGCYNQYYPPLHILDPDKPLDEQRI